MTPAMYRKERKQLISTLKKLTRTLLRPSGFVQNRHLPNEDPERYLKLWSPVDTSGKPTMKSFRLRGFTLQEFQGFTADGVLTDAHAGGMLTTSYSELPLEDLFKLKTWCERYLPAHRDIQRQVKLAAA